MLKKAMQISFIYMYAIDCPFFNIMRPTPFQRVNQSAMKVEQNQCIITDATFSFAMMPDLPNPRSCFIRKFLKKFCDFQRAKSVAFEARRLRPPDCKTYANVNQNMARYCRQVGSCI